MKSILSNVVASVNPWLVSKSLPMLKKASPSKESSTSKFWMLCCTSPSSLLLILAPNPATIVSTVTEQNNQRESKLSPRLGWGGSEILTPALLKCMFRHENFHRCNRLAPNECDKRPIWPEFYHCLGSVPVSIVGTGPHQGPQVTMHAYSALAFPPRGDSNTHGQDIPGPRFQACRSRACCALRGPCHALGSYLIPVQLSARVIPRRHLWAPYYPQRTRLYTACCHWLDFPPCP